MVERLLEEDELLLDTPWLRKIRTQVRAAAVVERRVQDILNILKWRFDPPISEYEAIDKALQVIRDESWLEALLKLAIEVKTIEEFRTELAELTKEA